MYQFIEKYKHWRFKNTFLLLVSLVLLLYVADSHFVQSTIKKIGELGYLGAFLTGIFFVSTFTVAPASVVLFYLAKEFSPLEIALFAGVGAVVGDYIFFRFLRDRVFEELKPVIMSLGGVKLSHLLATPYFAWLMPVLGAIIIASPLPDEVGVALISASKLRNWQFLLLSFALNSVGIFIILSLAQYFL